MISSILLVLLNILAFMLCIIAFAYKKYWILLIMFIVGISGVLIIAYLRAKGLLKMEKEN